MVLKKRSLREEKDLLFLYSETEKPYEELNSSCTDAGICNVIVNIPSCSVVSEEEVV